MSEGVCVTEGIFLWGSWLQIRERQRTFRCVIARFAPKAPTGCGLPSIGEQIAQQRFLQPADRLLPQAVSYGCFSRHVSAQQTGGTEIENMVVLEPPTRLKPWDS
ncbi:hypothetical protein SAMN04487970_100764 [Paenibacillus tianmuensis]|uniref:Uncharacterized protein n=1 Tax=Paenibacillus tianmuensis TaxID=624147 RepID=A0A1G4QHI1_9BACL|nr:hypothetical protein SAMN04487970_100764 [Paenibacillus tianmuensis]